MDIEIYELKDKYAIATEKLAIVLENEEKLHKLIEILESKRDNQEDVAQVMNDIKVLQEEQKKSNKVFNEMVKASENTPSLFDLSHNQKSKAKNKVGRSLSKIVLHSAIDLFKSNRSTESTPRDLFTPSHRTVFQKKANNEKGVANNEEMSKQQLAFPRNDNLEQGKNSMPIKQTSRPVLTNKTKEMEDFSLANQPISVKKVPEYDEDFIQEKQAAKLKKIPEKEKHPKVEQLTKTNKVPENEEYTQALPPVSITHKTQKLEEYTNAKQSPRTDNNLVNNKEYSYEPQLAKTNNTPERANFKQAKQTQHVKTNKTPIKQPANLNRTPEKRDYAQAPFIEEFDISQRRISETPEITEENLRIAVKKQKASITQEIQTKAIRENINIVGIPLKILLRIISHFYSMLSSIKKSTQEIPCLQELIFSELLTCYGLRTIAERKFLQVIAIINILDNSRMYYTQEYFQS